MYVTPPRKKDENGLIDPLMVHEEADANLTLAGGTGEHGAGTVVIPFQATYATHATYVPHGPSAAANS